MITGINYLRIFSVMITDLETNFKDVQANDFGNLQNFFFGWVMFVWTMV